MAEPKTMKKILKWIVGILLFCAFVVGVGWIQRYTDFDEPPREKAAREALEEAAREMIEGIPEPNDD